MLGHELFTSFLRTKWTLPSGWEPTNVGDTKIQHTSVGRNSGSCSFNDISVVIGKSYRVTITVDSSSSTSNTNSFNMGGANTSKTFGAVGTYTYDSVALLSRGLIVSPSPTVDFSINSISIKEILPPVVLVNATIRNGVIK